MTSNTNASGPTAREMRKRAGKWLQQLRKAAGLRQSDIGEELGHSYTSTVSQIERGLLRLPPEHWVAWAELLSQDAQQFAQRLLYWYDPHAYYSMFGGDHPQKAEGLTWEPSSPRRCLGGNIDRRNVTQTTPRV